jgi:hypothetical protein
MARELTLKQRRFVERVTAGTAPMEAAALAGYAVPSQDAYRLMRHPLVLQTIRDKRQARIQGDLASVALRTMGELMTGETVPAAQRFQASRWVLEHAGHAVPADLQGTAAGKALEDMSPDELATAVQSGMQALQELAGQLAGHHVIDGKVRQVLDVLPADDPDDYIEGDPLGFLS